MRLNSAPLNPVLRVVAKYRRDSDLTPENLEVVRAWSLHSANTELENRSLADEILGDGAAVSGPTPTLKMPQVDLDTANEVAWNSLRSERLLCDALELDRLERMYFGHDYRRADHPKVVDYASALANAPTFVSQIRVEALRRPPSVSPQDHERKMARDLARYFRLDGYFAQEMAREFAPARDITQADAMYHLRREMFSRGMTFGHRWDASLRQCKFVLANRRR